MEITIRDSDGVKIVCLEGNLDTNTSPEANDRLVQLLEQGETRILINLEKLDYISSAGLRVLLATAKEVRNTGGDLRICSLNATVREVFEISGFDTILNVFGSESEALDGS